MTIFKSFTRIAAIGLALAAGLLAMAHKPALAQSSSSWTNVNGGSWPTAGNWNGGVIADGANNTADLRGNTSGQKFIDLDASRTIGNLRFGSNGQLNYYTLRTGSSGSVLTLSVTTGTSFIDVQSSRNAEISAVIAGTQGFQKLSAGTLYLSGSSTYSGTTWVTAGNIELSGVGALGATGAGNETVVSGTARVRVGNGVTTAESFIISGTGFAGGGALNFGSNLGGNVDSTVTGLVTLAADAQIGASSTGGVVNGTLDRLGAGDSVNTNGFALTFVGSGNLLVKSPIVGSGGFTHNGSGSVTLTAANTYTGPTSFGSAISNLVLGDGGTSGSLSSSSTLTLTNANATFTVNQSDTVTQGVDFGSAAITGNGNFVQAGSGKTILNAANAYKGATSVNAGTLLINGNQSGATGAMTVAAGATLGGSGTVGGNTTITGIHSPGNSPGIQTFNGDLTYEAGAVVNWELIANSTGSAGTNYDQIVLPTSGNLNFSGATTLALSFNGAGSAVNWSNAFWDVNRSWMVYDLSAGAVSNAGNLTVGGSLLDSLGNSLSPTGRGYFNTSLSGQDVMLNFVAVPEPSSLVLLSGLAVGGLLVRRRRGA